MLKSTEVRRPRSSQKVSVNWQDSENMATQRTVRLQFEVAECVETKTITTTTTTKRSYPPLFVREPRNLNSLDSKEYPLASRPTPPELRNFTLALNAGGRHRRAIDDDEFVPKFTIEFEDAEVDDKVAMPSKSSPRHANRLHLSASSRRSHEFSTQQSNVGFLDQDKSDMDSDDMALVKPITRQKTVHHLPSSRRSLRARASISSPSNHVTANRQTHQPSRQNSLPHTASDKLRRAVTSGSRKQATRSSSTGYLATPNVADDTAADVERSARFTSLRLHNPEDGSKESSMFETRFDVTSPAASDAHTIISTTNVTTPPITDADLHPFGDDGDELLQQLTNPHITPRVAVAAQDASLPSPRLSPTLAAQQMHHDPVDDEDEQDEAIFSQDPEMPRPERSHFPQDSQSTQGDQEEPLSPFPFDHGFGHNQPIQSRMMDARFIIESFDAMPNEMKSFMMYQFLRRCPRKTLHIVADAVNPALKCDFLKQLPLELSLQVLSYLDHGEVCRAAQVSKQWRNIVDSDETGWKARFDRDGFVLTPDELQQAIAQGWGWQDPAGAEGCELDLSMQKRLTLPESELYRAASKTDRTEFGTKRPAKRKRASNYMTADRAKRRASAQQEGNRDVMEARLHKSEGPNSAANAAALAVPNPQIGLASLRKLHLFKSLYRRHYMIRMSWTSGRVRPSHVAFAAHPRHVITCLQFDEDKIVTGSDDCFIHVYDTKTGKLRTKLDGHEGGVWALQYEGNTLVSGSTDRTVRVWDISRGICTHTFLGHTSTVRCLQILMPQKVVQDGKAVPTPARPLIITGSRDSQLRVWRLPDMSRRHAPCVQPTAEGECAYFVRVLLGHAHSVRAISAHGDTLVSGSYDSTVRVWRISTGEQLHVLNGHSQKVYSVVLDHKRNRCISGSMDSLVKIWDLDTGACLYTLEGHSLLVGLLDLRDERLVSAAADSTLRIWDPETGKCKSTLLAHTGAITCFQHDGRKVISGSEKTVKMWDIHTGECIQDLLTDLTGVWQVKFDGRRCVAAVQRDNLTYVEILDFGAIRDGVPREELGKRMLLNEAEVQRIIAEDP